MNKNATQVEVVALEKTYYTGEHKVPVLRGVNLSIGRGELLSIIGQSGSGKSTLLHLIGLLDSPDVGEVILEGERIDDLPARARDQLRNRLFGFIFQFYHLMPELTLLDNVLMPLMIRDGVFKYWGQQRTYREEAISILERVGLTHRLKHRPSELSGGEMQRAAIARALISHPQVLLADEPTGNLDRTTGGEIMKLLRDLNENEGLTIVMVTHDQRIAAQADRTVTLVEGRVESATAVAA
ncbi:ABC transporter ATP-binding protein [Calycomorphotria hydatis]|uniref:P-loop containing nucleoside triphosphate hydrolase n=1 Tax=Calycomorphotria hydatis TaxID=2528027 RepID=A0A517TAY7_9PLAN|nr:ABC transporter ATP-binding protein [Calycomorphotria hydatis]QDT65536.1 P-loop containing nucleoside triphosphate hydrolase [Calycomorphotria hydatis]